MKGCNPERALKYYCGNNNTEMIIIINVDKNLSAC